MYSYCPIIEYDTVAFHAFRKLADTTPEAGVAYFKFIDYMDVEDDDLLPKPWFENLFLDVSKTQNTIQILLFLLFLFL